MASGIRQVEVYIHFPFCLSKCAYCDYNSFSVGRDSIPHHVLTDAILREWSLRLATLDPPVASVGSLYFGGGTPSLWSPESIESIIEQIASSTQQQLNQPEVTLECNPVTLDVRRASQFRTSGVTRLSIGVQSTMQEQLRTLGRTQQAPDGLRAVGIARKAGFSRVGGDIIFGIPGETPELARQDVLALASAGVDHISAYMLGVAPETRLGRAIAEGSIPEVDEQATAEAFLAISEQLVALGFGHYEVSNFALPGCECRHNLSIWRGGEYLGLGPGAVGFLRIQKGRVVRIQNRPNPADYFRSVSKANPSDTVTEGDLVQTVEDLDADTILAERIMLGLRLAEGLDIGAVSRAVGVTGWTRRRQNAARMLVAGGRLERHGDRVAIPRRQWLWGSDTTARLL